MMNSGSETTQRTPARSRGRGGARPRRRHHPEEQRERDHERDDDRRQDHGVPERAADVVPDRLRPRRVSRGRVAEITREARRRASRSSARPRAGRDPSARASRRAARAAPCVRATALAVSPGSSSVPTKTSAETTSRVEAGEDPAEGEASEARAVGPLRHRDRRGHRERRPPHSSRAAGGARVFSRLQPDVPVVPPAQVEERAGRDPAHVRRCRVDDVLVRPHDVAALVELALLHLIPEFLRRRLVRRADRVLDQLVVLLVPEVRLVPDGVREAACTTPRATSTSRRTGRTAASCTGATCRSTRSRPPA